MKHQLRIFLVSLAVMACWGFANAQTATYVGPEKCLQCHNNPALGDMTGWRTSLHANGYSHVPDDSRSMQDLYGVVADYDQNGIDDFKDGLDFNTISSAFDPYKPNAPILGYNATDGYTITMGQVKHKVYLTYGGSGLYKQRYMLKINTSQGESAALYISPVQYNEKTHEYVLYHPDAWYDASNMPIYTPASTLTDAAGNNRSMPKGCAGCHMTGLEVEQDTNGEWLAHGATVDNEALYTTFNNVFDIDGDGDLDQINVSCERCHGPGSEHAATTDTSKIINPAKLTSEQANNLCGMCHSRGKSTPNNTFGFPFDDANLTSWTPGDLVSDFYTDGGGDWPDGVHSKQHHQQFLDFYESSKPTFQFHKVACFECHDVHNEVKHHIREQIVEEDSLGAPITINTDNDDNTLCLSCHATHGDFAAIPTEWVADAVTHRDDIAAVVTQHTHHPYDPDGATSASRCSKCHNPKIVKSAIAYDIHAHTFEPIPPRKTEIFQSSGSGMPNACAASCHMQNGLTFGIDFSGDNLTAWNEATDLALADSLMHYYGPTGIWWNDSTFITGIEQVSAQIPNAFSLEQNYPNPFNPSTTIVFDLTQMTNIRLTVYNILGQQVQVLAKGIYAPGSYQVTFDGAGLASGLYVYRLETADGVLSKKMVLMK